MHKNQTNHAFGVDKPDSFMAAWDLLLSALLSEQQLQAWLGRPSMNDFLRQNSLSKFQNRILGKTLIESRYSRGACEIMSTSLPLRCFQYTSTSLLSICILLRLEDPKPDILEPPWFELPFSPLVLSSGLRAGSGLSISELDLVRESVARVLILMAAVKSALEGIICWGCLVSRLVMKRELLHNGKGTRRGSVRGLLAWTKIRGSSAIYLLSGPKQSPIKFIVIVFNLVPIELPQEFADLSSLNVQKVFNAHDHMTMPVTFCDFHPKGTYHCLLTLYLPFCCFLLVLVGCCILVNFVLNLNIQLMDQQACNDSIQVVVRIRPGCEDEAVVYTNTEIKLDRHSFAFDRVFGPQAHQEDLFVAVGKRLLTHTLEGYNSCIFVYGQTGSGKTFTMMGNNSGMMQRSFAELFARIDRMADTECIVTCSYYELYNEQIIDLLDKSRERKNLNIRQDVRRGMFVEGLTEESAMNADKLLECLMIGMKNRHIGETQMNRESSRSHSIFTISLAIKSEIDGKKVLKTPKLHFVDLAGSERQKMTMATGDRLKQAGNINKSLTTLGMVINALASDRPKVHIPYRDSKLTCLLRDSLGGNSKTFIVATISTSILCFQETLSTLNFANRAKMVKVKALVNEESLSTNLEQYKEEIRRLKQEILRLKSEKRVNFEVPPPNDTVVSKNSSDLDHKFELITHKIEDLKTNMMATSMDSIIEKLNQRQGQSMIQESPTPMSLPSDQMEAEGNELIEYMVSNHDLLKKIHSTIAEYRDLKEEIKSVEFSRRSAMQDMRTPSKFERDQYQDLLIRRETHIKELEERVIQLKELNFKTQSEVKNLRKKASNFEQARSEQGQLERVRAEQYDLQRKVGELQLRCDMLQEERKTLRSNMEELEGRVRESKELYLYTEQKYENQRFVRGKLENTLKEINRKHQQSEVQRRQELQEMRGKMEAAEQKLLEAERREEDMKTQQEILNETLQFNKRKMREYSQKLQENNKQLQQASLSHSKLAQDLMTVQMDAERKQIQLTATIDALNHAKSELYLNKNMLEEALNRTRNEKNALSEELTSLREAFRSNMQEYNSKIETLEQERINVAYQYEEFKVAHNKTIADYEIKVFSFEKTIANLTVQITTLTSWKEMMEEKYQTERTAWEGEAANLNAELQSQRNEREALKAQLFEKDKKLSEAEAWAAANKGVIEAHEQLKRSYKEILKDNYRLKGEYNSGGVAAKNQQLVSKVAFYEEKFKLMSIQYNKVQDTTKRLKQKQLSLLKRIEYYEENEKLKKIHSSSEAEEVQLEQARALQAENDELKEAIQKSKTAYEALLGHDRKEDYSKRLTLENERYELEQREQKIRQRLESAIKNWDHAKQNNCAGMNLDDLFGCWAKIEAESRKKFEGIAKAIKREQKLKSQNNFILKENFYLREKLEALQKDFNMQALGNPRKRVKEQEIEGDE